MTAEELGNQFGYKCPKCGRGDYLHITVTRSVALCPDGTDDDTGDTEWDEKSPASCGDCQWAGLVSALVTVELDA